MDGCRIDARCGNNVLAEPARSIVQVDHQLLLAIKLHHHAPGEEGVQRLKFRGLGPGRLGS